MEFSFSNEKEFDVVTIGRATIDLNSDDFNTGLENARSFSKFLGGSPANIAVACSRLNLKTAFIGKVGNDQFGKFLIDNFNGNHVDTSQIVVDETGARTGLTFTEIKSPNESNILMYRENVADLNLLPKEINKSFMKQTKILLVSGTALSKSPSREAIFTAIHYAKQQGVKIVFDIDYRPYTWTSDFETSIYYRLVAQQSDIIIGTKDEFATMDYINSNQKSEDKDIADQWLNDGVQIVVIKKGANGSIAFTQSGNSYEQRPFPAKIIKTFGAGDSYAAAFLYGLINGYDIKTAMEIGSASASIVISSQSSSEAMPTIEEINSYREKFKNVTT